MTRQRKKTNFTIEETQGHPDCIKVAWCDAHPEHKTCHCTEWHLLHKGQALVSKMTKEQAERLLAAIEEEVS